MSDGLLPMNTLESRPTRSSASRKAAGFDDQAVEGKDVRLDISIDRSGPVPGTPSATPTLEEGVDGAIYLKIDRSIGTSPVSPH